MKLSVIIVSYNCMSILKKCLDSISKYENLNSDIEIIISDNSTNNSIENLVRSDYQWVKYIKNDNIGFGAGNNRGAALSTGEYLLFLNPDTVFVEPIFDFAIKQFDSDNRLAMFGVQLIDVQGRNTSSIGLIERKGIIRDLIGWRVLIPNNYFVSREMYIVGADIFIRRELFFSIGLFDENIFMYHEESDLTRRLFEQYPDYRTAYFPEKKIMHLEGGTEPVHNKKTDSMLARQAESYVYFHRKYNLNPLIYWKRKRIKLIIKKYIYSFIRNRTLLINIESDLYNVERLLCIIADLFAKQ